MTMNVSMMMNQVIVNTQKKNKYITIMEQVLMAGHEPIKGEVTSPMERLHNDIRKANDTPIQRDTTEHKEEKQLDCTDQLLECTSECDPMIRNVRMNVLRSIRNVNILGRKR